MTRRELLQRMATLMAAVAACRAREEVPDATTSPDAQPVAADPTHALLPPQRAILAAAMARILPTDESPGAAEANVIEYLDRQLVSPDFADIKGRLLAGLTALNRLAMRGGHHPFIELAADEQDRVLRETETGSPRGKDFIYVLTMMTLEGFFGDPRWGGNKGGAGWQLAGYGPGTLDGEVHGHH